MALVFLLANLALQYGAARLTAQRTAVVMLTEVLFAAVSAVLVGGERLTPGVVVGGVLIVVGAALAVPTRQARPTIPSS